MSFSETPSDLRNSHLEQLFNRAKPKARYISETHIEEETSSIAKEIINGDIQVRKTKQGFSKNNQKNNYEQMLRKKYMEQIEKQKEVLEHKLGYIENSLTSFEKYEFLRKRGSTQGDLSLSRQKGEEWRKQFEEEMKKIEQKKREIAQRSRERQSQSEQLRARIQEQDKMKQKAVIQQSIKKIKERNEKRQGIVRQQNQKLKQLLSKKELFQKMQEKYSEKQGDILEQRKKKLAEIRQLKKPINLQQILEHQQRVLQIMKDKQSQRDLQKKMNSSRTRSYRPSYQSAFYKQLATTPPEEQEGNPKQKLEKMRQFSQQVKTNFVPEIDQNKRRQIEERTEKEIKHKIQREEKEKELIEKPKLIGLEYLELVKRMPKKNNSPQMEPKSDRIQYKNYLGNMSLDMGKQKPWKTILDKGEHRVETALLLQYQSQKLQQRLKRKQQYTRLMKLKDDGSIDQEYYEMVKAKLNLLGKD